MSEFVIGIDIGGTNFRIGAVRKDGTVEHLEKVSSKVLSEGGTSIDRLIWAIGDYIARCDLDGRVAAIAIGFPSPVSKDKKIVYHCANLTNENGGFDNQDVVTPVGDAFGVPVFIEKDAVFLLEYDLVRRDLRSKGTTIGVYFGTGIGNMVYLNGQFLVGKHGASCQLGHVPFYLSDRYCTCGNRGCSEAYAAGHVLRSIWEKHYSDTDFSQIFVLHGDDEIIRNFVEAQAVPLATEIDIFDPDYVVLGGGVLEMPGYPLDQLKAYVSEFCHRPYPGDDFEYFRASNAVDIGVIGAGYYAWERLN